MKRSDLRNKIIPTTMQNTDICQNLGSKSFDTTDKIYLDSYDEQYDDVKTDIERIISATDYAQMNNAYIDKYSRYKTRTGKLTTCAWLRTAFNSYGVNFINIDGSSGASCTSDIAVGICPSLHYHIPSNLPSRSLLSFFRKHKNIKKDKEFEQLDIKHIKDIRKKVIYHTLQIGEYPKTIVDENLSQILESLYNGGKVQKGLFCTGRWYSCNGQKGTYLNYAGKHSPEFEYEGKRYVRVISNPTLEESTYSDGTPTGKPGTIRWVQVEPISFVIKNWDDMPKSINPRGKGKANYFDLRAEEVIISSIPFYPYEDDKNSSLWQNSSIRAFLNGIDVRNIKLNGNIKYGANDGGVFTGECNFLNEAFNLSREPIVEYTIPDSETEIPDDAFNGCITLRKLIMHSGIEHIGKRAFDGLHFKHAYKTKSGALVFSQELLKVNDEYIDVIDLDKMLHSFDDFDYSILVQNDNLGEIINFSEVLSKNKFSIPYAYGLELIQSKNVQSFLKNTDFRFFKNEMPDINKILLNFPEEERLNFFKFANSLGCFSQDKILDKKGNKTDILLAQKASSLLAIIFKTGKIKLR